MLCANAQTNCVFFVCFFVSIIFYDTICSTPRVYRVDITNSTQQCWCDLILVFFHIHSPPTTLQSSLSIEYSLWYVFSRKYRTNSQHLLEFVCISFKIVFTGRTTYLHSHAHAWCMADKQSTVYSSKIVCTGFTAYAIRCSMLNKCKNYGCLCHFITW